MMMLVGALRTTPLTTIMTDAIREGCTPSNPPEKLYHPITEAFNNALADIAS